MNLSRSIGSFFLAIVILAKTTILASILLQFSFNHDQFVNLYCANKDFKEMLCSGKCYISEAYAYLEGNASDSTLPDVLKVWKVDQFIDNQLLDLQAKDLDEVIQSNPNFVYTEGYSNDFLSQVLRPPATVVLV